MCEIIEIGNSTAFICGGNKNHECNEDASVYETADGKRYFFKNGIEARKWYEENWNILNICMGSVACSICGGAAIDNAWKL